MRVTLYSLKIPMKQHFKHSAKTRQFAESLVLVIEYKNVAGIGESAPRSYVTGETVESIFESFQRIDLSNVLNSLLVGNLNEAMNFIKNSDLYNEKLLSQNMCCVLEMAVLDWLGKYFKCSLANIINKYYFNNDDFIFSEKPIKTTQVLDMSLDVKEFLNSRGPFHTIKIKASSDQQVNYDIIKEVREKVGNNIDLIVDANMSWTLETAKENIGKLSEFNIAYYEEPLAKNDWKNYQRLRKTTTAKIMLDESLCNLDDADKAVSYGAVDAFNIRLAKCGGISNSIRLINFAKAHSIDYQIGAQVAEVGPLISASRQLAMIDSGYFTFEAGQPDRFFDEKYVISPMPLVNRTTNLAYPISGDGLGISLTSYLYMYCYKQAYFKDGRWI